MGTNPQEPLDLNLLTKNFIFGAVNYSRLGIKLTFILTLNKKLC